MISEFRRNLVIAHVANDYHSGQWSRGYRLSCRVQRWFVRRGYTHMVEWPLISTGEKKLYATLAAKYGEKL